MGDPPTNLRVIKRSRTKPQAGDVFTMQLPDNLYLFGRVIEADLPSGRAPMPTANLIYIYRHRSASTRPDLDALTPDQLLLPPTFINRMPWTKGYFHNIANYPLKPSDLLAQHCFWDVLRKGYVDKDGQPIRKPIDPCGEWGLASYRIVDDEISDALNIPRVPEDA